MRYLRQDTFLDSLDFDSKELHEKIINKRIVVVGCGGAGSVLSELLVRAGFLNLVLVDFDKVDLSNLGRQVFFEKDLGKFKAKVLAKYLKKIDKLGFFEIFCDKLDSFNCKSVFSDCDLIVDACDNFETRKIINSFCENNDCDWVYNGAIRSEFISCLFCGKDKLFESVFPKEVKGDDNCDVGVLASSVFGCASLGLNVVLKYFLGIRESRMIKVDLWKGKLFDVKLK